MKRLCLVVAPAIGVILYASTAQAQTGRRFGFVIGYPASVGVQWQAANRLTFRFDGSYRHSAIESSATPTPTPLPIPLPDLQRVFRVPVFEVRSSTSTTAAELAGTVMFDVYRSDELRLYIAPSIGVLMSKTEIETTITGLGPAELAAFTFPANQDATSHSPTAGVAIGASHDLSPRFRMFGEAGFDYSRHTVGSFAITDIKQSSFGLRSGVGAVVLF